MTWLVETAPKRTRWTPADAVDEWTTRSGYGRKESALFEAQQIGAHWRKQGLKVRVRLA